MRQTWTTWPRRVRWPLLSMLVAVLGLGTLYGGYCSALWGRNTLLLQYLFQCNCPAVSEAVRYSDFTVLAPACRWPEVEAMSGDGRYIIVTEHAVPRASYRLDLQTRQRQSVLRYDPARKDDFVVGSFWFLTNDLLLMRGEGKQFILIDALTNTQIPLRWQYVDQSIPQLLQILRTANQIYIASTAAVVLAPNPFQNPDQNVILYSESLDSAKLQAQLHAQGVTIPLIHPERPFGTKAGTARTAPLLADQYGIYTSYVPTGDTVKVLLRRTGFTRAPSSFRGYSARGWTTNDAAVVYTSPLRYVIYRKIVFGTVSLLPVPQPVLLLDAPPLPPGGE